MVAASIAVICSEVAAGPMGFTMSFQNIMLIMMCLISLYNIITAVIDIPYYQTRDRSGFF